jgi:uncharacterized protein YecE (DUF72 family)
MSGRSIRIGVSGWSYGHWRKGAWYPEDLPQKRELEYIAKRFNSAEINGSFYSLLKPDTYRRYRDTVPDGFVFAVKGSQFITHSKKLKDTRVPLSNFMASGVLRLEDKLGPILWQFPQMKFDLERVRAFLDLLPRDTQSASKLAGKHDKRVSGRASMVVYENRPMRHALEFRHPEFFREEIVDMCRSSDTALVFSDSGDWPCTEEVTAGWVYLRLHGSPNTYATSYGQSRLRNWADRVQVWAGGDEPGDANKITDKPPPSGRSRDVYVYFDNDYQANAPRDAEKLMELLEVPSPV